MEDPILQESSASSQDSHASLLIFPNSDYSGLSNLSPLPPNCPLLHPWFHFPYISTDTHDYSQTLFFRSDFIQSSNIHTNDAIQKYRMSSPFAHPEQPPPFQRRPNLQSDLKSTIFKSFSYESSEYMITSIDEQLGTSPNESFEEPVAQLIPETSMSVSMFSSREALSRAEILTTMEDESIEDDSKPLVNPVLFCEITASKERLESDLNKGKSQKLTLTAEAVENQEMYSPIVRKIVVWREIPEHIDGNIKQISLEFCIPASGFMGAPSLQYSSTSNNQAFIPHKKNLPLIGLLSAQIFSQISTLKVTWISSGFEHVAFSTLDGLVFTWGHGASGCLGHTNYSSFNMPIQVMGLRAEVVSYIECGAYHTAAVSDKGDLWVWGRGDVHQIGIDQTELIRDQMGYVALSPLKVPPLNCSVKSVACGEAHTIVLLFSGQIRSFGWAQDGQLGIPIVGKSLVCSKTIEKVQIPFKIAKIAAGTKFSACVTESGLVYVWGNGDMGQLGIGNRVVRSEYPSLIGALKHEKVMSIVCGELHMICFCESGKAYGWGKGIVGDFDDIENYQKGSEIICFFPKELKDVDIIQRVLIN